MNKEDLTTYFEIENEVVKTCNNLIDEYRELWYATLGIDEKWHTTKPYDYKASELAKLEIEYKRAPTGYETFDSIDDNYIYFSGDEYWSYGGHEKHSYHLPTKYLFEDWRPELIEKLTIQINNYLNKKEEAKEKFKLEELNKLAELKAKYEV